MNYRTASEIYQARDLGFSREEIGELFDKDAGIVDFTFNDEKKIGGRIKKVLRKIYRGRNIDKSYKDFEE